MKIPTHNPNKYWYDSHYGKDHDFDVLKFDLLICDFCYQAIGAYNITDAETNHPIICKHCMNKQEDK